jgi:hypothetical protein
VRSPTAHMNDLYQKNFEWKQVSISQLKCLVIQLTAFLEDSVMLPSLNIFVLVNTFQIRDTRI